MINKKIQASSKASSVLFLLFISVILITGCDENCSVRQVYTYYEPIYTNIEEIRTSITVLPEQSLSQTGKIFYSNGYLFINKPNEGVHVIDNRNPSNPENIAFINIPGSFDLAVKGNILFSDSYIDLVAIDISDLQDVKETGRIKNVFNSYNSYGFYADPQLGVVTGWKEMEQVQIGDCQTVNYEWGMHYDRGIAMNEQSFSNDAIAVPVTSGVGGSMARFALVENYLYAIDYSDLFPVDITNSSVMEAAQKVSIGWGIETIFPKGDKLFIGAQNGMHIMDVYDPLHPSLISSYEHVTSCDPVVVDGDYAYVTLRSGSECQGFTNQLEVIDISDLSSPELLFTYEMYNPHGLGKDGDLLFICDGTEGLKIYNAADVSVIDQNLIVQYKNIQAFDIIPFNKTAMLLGEDGLYQYDYSDASNIKYLSHIPLNTMSQ